MATYVEDQEPIRCPFCEAENTLRLLKEVGLVECRACHTCGTPDEMGVPDIVVGKKR